MDQIFRKITDKGWNIYQATDKETPDVYIPRGPVASLEPKNQYILFPSVKNPTNTQEVIAKLQEAVNQGKGQLIMLGNNMCVPIPIIYPTETSVYTPGTDAVIPLQQFIKMLDHLQEAPRY